MQPDLRSQCRGPCRAQASLEGVAHPASRSALPAKLMSGVVVNAISTGCDHLPKPFGRNPLLFWEVVLYCFFGLVRGHSASGSQRLNGGDWQQMMNFDQRVGDLVRSVTSLKGRSHHGGIIHSQIIDAGSVRFQAGTSAAAGLQEPPEEE
jgi:hypothetical protein